MHEQNLSLQEDKDSLVKEITALKLKQEKLSNDLENAEKQIKHYMNEVEI